MRSLIVLLDEAAPSFCYYQPRAAGPSARMTRETFARVVAFADARGLTLQLLCGRDGADAFVDDLVGARPHTRYVPLGSAPAAPGDVLVIDGPEWDDAALPAARHPVCVLRVRREDLARVPPAWERLSERVYRTVLVVRDVDGWDVRDLGSYRAALADLSTRLAAKYLRGEATELSVLSDRLGLAAPAECGAGVDHLTVTPGGELHVCPGFALEGEPSIGSLTDGRSIPGGELVERARAPICSACDAYQCRRCVYVHRRATREVNTPPWQVCRAAHVEREASRVMLDALHERRCLERLPPIPPLDYADPLDKLMQMRHGTPRGLSAAATPERAPEEGAPQEPPRPSPLPVVAACESARCVGRVTPEERDEIQAVHRRKVALTALLSALAKMDAEAIASTPLYDRLVRDMGETIAVYDAWWERTATKYRWRRERPDQTWHLDFSTCDVLLD